MALEYSDRGEFVDRQLLAALAVEPVLVNVVVWTNDVHELFWKLDWSRAQTPITDTHGVLFFVHVAYMYVLVMTGVLVMSDVIARRERLFRVQSVALGFAAVVPLVANVLFVTETVGFDPTPPAFLVSGVTFYWAVVGTDLAYVTTPDATALFGCYDPRHEATRDLIGFRADPANRGAARIVQYEYDDELGEPWLFRLFTPDEVRDAVVGTGWRVADVETGPEGWEHTYSVTLAKR
ncbi:histidine kinase N-terminal 7TM domain-containing protein [Halorubellus sp. PRR65]|uniref:histidine kinase N-terminal 7TM domain-containing protein n=1 Tax=Halorubellus sp. PRR65 TaxID=3098148 RepID=UPI002B263B8D|nr:histidine kinase N-terminal 7TM domain-containing protein [Halorubellus sp. PRR65]